MEQNIMLFIAILIIAGLLLYYKPWAQFVPNPADYLPGCSAVPFFDGLRADSLVDGAGNIYPLNWSNPSSIEPQDPRANFVDTVTQFNAIDEKYKKKYMATANLPYIKAEDDRLNMDLLPGIKTPWANNAPNPLMIKRQI